MKKYKVKTKNGQLEIKHRLGKGEELNNRELEILARNNIRGLARVQETSSRGITFVGPEAVPLNSYLSGGLAREDFAFVIAQIVRIAQKINDYSLQQNNLELTVETVYIVRKTRELIFVYRPVISTTAASDINSFINSVIRCTSFSMQQDTKYVEELENMLRKMEKFPSEMMANYVRRLDTQIYNLFLSDRKPVSMKKYVDEDLTSIMDDEEELTGILDEDDDEELTGILDEDDDFGVWNNSDQDSLSKADEELTSVLDEDDDYLPTGILDDEGEMLTGIVEDEPENKVKGQSLLFGDDEEGDLYGFYGRNFGSTLIDEDEDNQGTSVMDEEILAPPVRGAYPGPERQPADNRTTLYRESPSTPWLQRCSTGERRDINKPVFRIGKDKYHVDYFVDGNPAVSRNHAHIISRNGRFFLVDNNSLNHSFVDGMIVPIQKEYEIFEGSNICLANEDFVFHVR